MAYSNGKVNKVKRIMNTISCIRKTVIKTPELFSEHLLIVSGVFRVPWLYSFRLRLIRRRCRRHQQNFNLRNLCLLKSRFFRPKSCTTCRDVVNWIRIVLVFRTAEKSVFIGNLRDSVSTTIRFALKNSAHMVAITDYY